MRNPVLPSSCVTPAGTSNELDVQNEWEENTHTHTHTMQGFSYSNDYTPKNQEETKHIINRSDLNYIQLECGE